MLRIGDTVERLTVLSQLGSGRTSVTYLVSNPDRRRFAMKVLGADGPQARLKLRREGKMQRRLPGGRTVGVIDFLQVRGRLALLLDYVAGPSLGRLMSTRQLTVGELDQVAEGLCRALADMNRCGIVHGNLRPSKVLLEYVDDAWRVRIGGFSRARDEFDRRPGQVDDPQDPNPYGPPELGTPLGVPETDLYAVGAMLRQLVTGVAPGSTGPLPDHLPNRILEACERATHPDPEHRFESAMQLLGVWLDRPESMLIVRSEPAEQGGLDVVAWARHTARSVGLLAAAGVLVGVMPAVVRYAPDALGQAATSAHVAAIDGARAWHQSASFLEELIRGNGVAGAKTVALAAMSNDRLVELLDEDDPHVRRAVAEILVLRFAAGDLDLEEAVRRVALAGPPPVTEQAIDAIAARGTDIEGALELLTIDDSHLRLEALQAVERVAQRVGKPSALRDVFRDQRREESEPHIRRWLDARVALYHSGVKVRRGLR